MWRGESRGVRIGVRHARIRLLSRSYRISSHVHLNERTFVSRAKFCMHMPEIRNHLYIYGACLRTRSFRHLEAFVTGVIYPREARGNANLLHTSGFYGAAGPAAASDGPVAPWQFRWYYQASCPIQKGCSVKKMYTCTGNRAIGRIGIERRECR